MNGSLQNHSLALIATGTEGYGVARSMSGWLKGLELFHWKGRVICMQRGRIADSLEREGVEVDVLDMPVAPNLSGPLLRKPRELFDLWRSHRRALPPIAKRLAVDLPDAILVRVPNLVPLAGALAKKLGCLGFWNMPNSIGGRYPFGVNRLLYQWTCWRCNIVPLANSRYTASTFGNWPVRPKISPPPSDPDRFDPDRVEQRSREELGIPPSALTLGIFARITPDKGQDRVLQALALLPRDPPIHLIVAGGIETEDEQSYVNEMRRIAESHGLGDRVHFIGLIDDPERYYGAIDLPVNSRVSPEPFGLSVIEAMLMKRPILVHASGGPAESVLDGVTGWHAPNATPEAFVKGIQRALADRVRWGEMGETARTHAVENYSIRSIIGRFVCLAEEMLAAKLRPGPNKLA